MKFLLVAIITVMFAVPSFAETTQTDPGQNPGQQNPGQSDPAQNPGQHNPGQNPHQNPGHHPQGGHHKVMWTCSAYCGFYSGNEISRTVVYAEGISPVVAYTKIDTKCRHHLFIRVDANDNGRLIPPLLQEACFRNDGKGKKSKARRK